MNGRMIQALMLLIKSAVSECPLTESEKVLVNNEKAKNLLIIAEQHKLLPVAVQAAFSNELLDPQSELGVRAKKIHMSSVFRIQGMEFELGRIYDALENAGVEFVPLKGAVVRALYPEPWMRTSADIDILVKPEQLQKACDELSKIQGYSLKSGGSHDVKFQTESDVYLELHFDLMEDHVADGFSTILSNCWDYAQNVEGFKCQKSFENEFFLLYHVVHMAKHTLSGGCGIRPFVDLVLMQKHYRFDQLRLSKMLKESHVERFYEVCCELCDVWFFDKPHSETTERFEQYIVSGGVFGSYKNGAAVSKSRGRQKTKLQKLKFIVFLPTENMKMVYPNLKKHPWLLPFYHIKRWLGVFDKSKRNTVDSMITAGDDLSQDEALEIAQLMNELKLK